MAGDAFGAADADAGEVEITYQPPATGPATTPVIQEEPDDDNPDVLLLSLLTIGAAGGAAILAIVGFLVRQRIGFWLHRPPERSGDEPPGDHH